MNAPDELKAEFRDMMWSCLGGSGPIPAPPIQPTPPTVTRPPERKAKAVTPKPKAKARTWVAPHRTRDDHKRSTPDEGDFKGRTSAPLIYYGAREVDTMWQPGRRTGPNS